MDSRSLILFFFSIDPLSGSSKTYIQVISDADTLDDTNWDEEDLSGEFDEVEVEQDDESRYTDNSTKTSSGKTLSKRSFDELDSNDVPEASDPPEISSGMCWVHSRLIHASLIF